MYLVIPTLISLTNYPIDVVGEIAQNYSYVYLHHSVRQKKIFFAEKYLLSVVICDFYDLWVCDHASYLSVKTKSNTRAGDDTEAEEHALLSINNLHQSV